MEIKSLPCPHCKANERQIRLNREELAAEFSLKLGPPEDPEGIRSLEAADAALRSHYRAPGAQYEVSYDKSKVMESSHWWYLPFCWVGSAGDIVEKSDGAINSLGSGFPLRLWFWAHNRGLWTTLTDITILKVSSSEDARALMLDIVRVGPIGILKLDLAEREVDRIYTSLPVRLEGKELWHFFHRIEQLASRGEFEFSANPSARV
jgi:hypothetical protein